MRLFAFFTIAFLALVLLTSGMLVSLPGLGIAALALCVAAVSYRKQRDYLILTAPKRRRI